MKNSAALSLVLGILLVSATLAFSTSEDGAYDHREAVYNVTTKLTDDDKESTFAIKLKCRARTKDIIACSLYDPKYETSYHGPQCVDSSFCKNGQHLRADSSYVGNFEIKFRRSIVERLTVSSGTSLKQLSFYRIMANHLFLGVDVIGKNEGTYSLIEESVYGKCEALVKIVKMPRIDDRETLGNKKALHQTVSVKRTRNLETCNPVPALLIFDDFFYHPMMTAVHFNIKSSISRFIVSDTTFTSYTTEDIAVKNQEGGEEMSMLHIRTTLTQHSYAPASDPIPIIIDPVSVELPFVDGFRPINGSNNNSNKKNYTSTPTTI